MAMPTIAFLECSRCHAHLDAAAPQTACTACAGRFMFAMICLPQPGRRNATEWANSDQDSCWTGMWRYAQVLPSVEPVTLGEGWTPMLRSRRNANVWLKEEGANPTGTFKARGWRWR